jgi:hypothetical protein
MSLSKSISGNQILPTEYKPYRSWLCCTKYKDRSNFKNILKYLDIPDIQKEIIQIRYINILENFQRRSRNYSYIFFIGHFIITVGSLFVPALLSIQNSDKDYTFTGSNFSIQIYWTTFVISLLVTIFNGVLTLFKVDKKYYFLNTTLERLRSEGWQYFCLTGRYDGRLLTNEKPNHMNQFVYFTHYIEKFKMKQVAEEYYKADEKISQAPTTHNDKNYQNTISQELFPPSLDHPINLMKGTEPESIRAAVSSIIKSQKSIQNKSEDKNVIVIPEESKIRRDSLVEISISRSVTPPLTSSSSSIILVEKEYSSDISNNVVDIK